MLDLVLAILLAVAMPDPKLTPGVVKAGVTKEIVCKVGYTQDARHVTTATKRLVFQRYGIEWTKENRKLYEVDHLISLELGGDNVVENLWPEPWEPKPGARQKDVVETTLHRRVCKGELTLEEAQAKIRTDWF